MPYKRICELTEVRRCGNHNGVITHYTITSNPAAKMKFFEYIEESSYKEPTTPYWLYYAEGKEDVVVKGLIQSVYSTWGILRVQHFNDLQMYDFLFALDHRAQLREKSVGILYELT